MDLSLNTDGPLAHLRVVGSVGLAETGSLTDYLRVARENGSVRAIIDLAECTQLPTTIVPILTRESVRFEQLGGSLSLTGLKGQNPFLIILCSENRFQHYRSFDEAASNERQKARQQAALENKAETVPSERGKTG